MREIMHRFMKEGSGATAIEYALLAALIGVAIVALTRSVAARLWLVFQFIKGNLSIF